MSESTPRTFIIDCPYCRAKVAAIERGRAKDVGRSELDGQPYASLLLLGQCPCCSALLAGEQHQVDFEGWDGPEDVWSDIVRVHPKPPKTFLSRRIPRSVSTSIDEAEKSLQSNANIAACVMLGRALEGVCQDLLKEDTARVAADGDQPQRRRPMMLFAGIEMLKKKGLIDDRLYAWSKDLHAFRNAAAHPTDESISRADAEDLQSFVYAIIEYTYDLTDRYDEFKERMARKRNPPARGRLPVVRMGKVPSPQTAEAKNSAPPAEMPKSRPR